MLAVEIVHGVLLDETALTIEELARACMATPEWIEARVRAGLLGTCGDQADASAWRFTSADLLRSQRLAQAERVFGMDEHAAALVADLIEEVGRLRRLARRAGLE